jgi:2-phospho-L-lactate/phosphoenolpyruvate guanylyltransferase
MPIWAIVPVKPFREAKSRLSGALTLDERAALSRDFLVHTLTVLKEVREVSRALVISRDTSALHLAREHGAFTVTESGAPELNSAISRATDVIVRLGGAKGILVLPSDLPFINAGDIRMLIARSEPGDDPSICIAPDRRGDGTNALLTIPPKAIPYAFGVGSFQKHVSLANQLNVRVEVCQLASFALDVDVPDDFDLYQASKVAGRL